MDLSNHAASRLERARLSLNGLSVGDAFGERFVGPIDDVLPQIAARTLPSPPWIYTDDTEMALALVESLAESDRVDGDALARVFVRRYTAEPNRGYGGGAVRILHAIRAGTNWREASRTAFRGEGSRGNGAAMRVAPLGAYFADDVELAASQAGDSAKVTHAHPDGVAGAIAVAVAAAHACRLREREDTSAAHPALLDVALQHCPSGPTRDVLLIARQLPATTTTAKAARALGNGSRLLSCDTVPFALWCAQTYLHDYAEALWQTVSALGDRDTTCAIVGGVVGLVDPPPRKWLHARENLRFESLSDGSEPLQRIARRLEIWLRSIRSTRPNRP